LKDTVTIKIKPAKLSKFGKLYYKVMDMLYKDNPNGLLIRPQQVEVKK
jgi:hypothetical protein